MVIFHSYVSLPEGKLKKSQDVFRRIHLWARTSQHIPMVSPSISQNMSPKPRLLQRRIRPAFQSGPWAQGDESTWFHEFIRSNYGLVGGLEHEFYFPP